MRLDRDPVVCAVCKRAAMGIGYSPRAGAPIAWLCEDAECVKLGRVVFHMASKALNHHETVAIAEAGNEAGAFLDSIGKYDLATLEPDEYLAFLRVVLTSYEKAMRRRLLNHAAPF